MHASAQFYADTSDENSSKESLDLCNVYPCLLSQGINSNLKQTGNVLFYRPASAEIFEQSMGDSLGSLKFCKFGICACTAGRSMKRTRFRFFLLLSLQKILCLGWASLKIKRKQNSVIEPKHWWDKYTLAVHVYGNKMIKTAYLCGVKTSPP